MRCLYKMRMKLQHNWMVVSCVIIRVFHVKFSLIKLGTQRYTCRANLIFVRIGPLYLGFFMKLTLLYRFLQKLFAVQTI